MKLAILTIIWVVVGCVIVKGLWPDEKFIEIPGQVTRITCSEGWLYKGYEVEEIIDYRRVMEEGGRLFFPTGTYLYVQPNVFIKVKELEACLE